MLRSTPWLQAELDHLLKNHFSDLEVPNKLTVRFGRRTKRRMGSINMSRDQKESRITINGLFRDPAIPEQIICSTLAHELCHYVHGFSSPLPRRYSSPHAGGVVQRELRKRGLYLLHQFEKQWFKSHWPQLFPRLLARDLLPFLDPSL